MDTPHIHTVIYMPASPWNSPSYGCATKAGHCRAGSCCNREAAVGDLRVEQLYDETLNRHIRIARLLNPLNQVHPEQLPTLLRSRSPGNEPAGVHADGIRADRGRGLRAVVAGDRGLAIEACSPLLLASRPAKAGEAETEKRQRRGFRSAAGRGV